MSHMSDNAALKQIEAYDENSKSFNVKLLSNQFAVELNRNEDSITAYSPSMSIEAGVVFCADMKMLCLYGEGSVFVSPSDEGEDWFQLTLTQLSPSPICARRVKLEGSGKLVLHG